MGHTNPGEHRLDIEIQPVANDDKRDVILTTIVYKRAETGSHFNMLAGKVLQFFYGLPDKPVLPAVALLNRDTVLSVGSLNTLPVTLSELLSEKDTQIARDNRPVEITLYQHCKLTV